MCCSIVCLMTMASGQQQTDLLHFGESKVTWGFFGCTGVSAPNPCVVQGSTVLWSFPKTCELVTQVAGEVQRSCWAGNVCCYGLVSEAVFKAFPLLQGFFFFFLSGWDRDRDWEWCLWGKRQNTFFLSSLKLISSWFVGKQQTKQRSLSVWFHHLFAFTAIEPIKYLCYVLAINNFSLFIQPLNKCLSSVPAHILAHYLLSSGMIYEIPALSNSVLQLDTKTLAHKYLKFHGGDRSHAEQSIFFF